MFDKNKFANIIKKIKETYSNQEEFSKISNVGRTYLSQYMNAKLDEPPKPKTLKKIAETSNGITTYTELMLICDYLHDDFDDLMGDNIIIYNNPYTSNLKYNSSENFIFDVLYSFDNLDSLEYTKEEKEHITKIYNYITHNNDYIDLIKNYNQLKKIYNKQIKEEFEFAYHKDMEGLTEKEISDALRFYKEIKYGKENKKND